jgi:iron complex transport system ATP-binding protein
MNTAGSHMDLLQTIDLSIGYPSKYNKPLPGVFNLSARQGELVALVGKNGIGKSTLLKTLVKLQAPVAGNIFLEGKHLQEYSAKALSTRLGFVSTELVQVNNLRVYDLVALGRYPYTNWFGTNRKKDREMIEMAMHLVGIENLKEKNIRQISDGERQRAMIARTLAQDTRLIILDEPTAFLDLPNKYEIVHLLNKLAREQNKTVIFSTHELNIAIEEADKIWLMTPEGTHQGAPEDLIYLKRFTSMFDKKVSSYISEKGELKIRKDFNRKIGLNGQGKEYNLTKKALERIGIECIWPSEENEIVTVMPSDNCLECVYESNHHQTKFRDIYTLISFLKEYNKNRLTNP